MTEWRLTDGASYRVTGAPVVVEDLAAALTDSLLRLLVVALLVMAIVLALVFRSRLRLLPLAVALAAVAITFGAMSLLGASLTMASIAVLPVLLGLGVDYAIQYQARVEEEERGGAADTAEAAARTARASVPTIATAGLATAVGFLVLLLSPVPMVRGFGVLLVAGIAIAFFLALSAGTAALVARGAAARRARVRWRARRAAPRSWSTSSARALGRVARPLRRLGGRVSETLLRGALERPRRVLLIGLVIALGRARGRLADEGQLRPARARAAGPARRARPRRAAARDRRGGRDRRRGRGRRPHRPGVVTWMRDYQAGLLKRYGYSAKNGCGEGGAVPGAVAARPLPLRRPRPRTAQRVRALLDAVPAYFSQARDHGRPQDGDARVRRPADAARRAEARHRRDGARLDPPEGVTARLAGLPVLGAEANDALSSPLRRLGTLLAGLLAVGLVAARACYRARWERAWVPLVPIALATGWSALVLFALRVPLNPMSATLGALVIAISTEFSVLLTARYREERGGGPRARRGAAAHLPLDRRGGDRVRASRRSPASRCSRCRTSRCCRTSGASRSSTCRSRCSACSPCCPRC